MSWEWQYLLGLLAWLAFFKIIASVIWPRQLPDAILMITGFAMMAAPPVFLLWVLGA